MPANTFEQILKSSLLGSNKPLQEATHDKPTNTEFSIYKTDDDKRLVFGWASVVITTDGEQLEDRQKDIIDPEDLEEAAYEYVLNFRDTGEEHISTMRKKGKLVESCVLTVEKQKAMGIPEGTVPVGWWIGFKIEDDAAWQRVKNGTYRMFSIEGKANREPVEKSEQPTGCGVLVIQDGKVLAGTRIERNGLGKVCGPSGSIEAGETPEEAAIREAYEEFRIICRDLVPLGVQDTGGRYGKSAIFMCSDFSGAPKADEKEMTSAKWIYPREIDEAGAYPPFYRSLELLPTEKSAVAKTFNEILKFNPYHDARGRFASSNGYASFTYAPGKSKAHDLAIQRQLQRFQGGGASAFQGPGKPQNMPQKPAAPPKPKRNFDKLGFADQDDADFHQLHSGAKYYQQQKLTAKQQASVTSYLEAHAEPGSLYSHSQNLNYQMAQGKTLTGKYKQTHDGVMSAMHNIGYNVNLTRYDHADMVNGLLKATGAGSNYEKMSVSKIKKALVGQTINENKFLSASYNDFKNAPAGSKQVFNSRAVKINYKAKADVKAMMPGKGPGGDLGEIILAPTNGTTNRGGKITDVRLTGQMVRRKGTQMYNQPRIEIDIEI